MDDTSPPRNQQHILDNTGQNNSRQIQSPDRTRSSLESPFHTGMLQPKGETDMFSHQGQSPTLQSFSDSGNLCSSCQNCGQTLRSYSTPLKSDLGFSNAHMDSFLQRGAAGVANDLGSGLLDMNRIKTADTPFTDDLLSPGNMSHSGIKQKDDSPPPTKAKKEKKETKTITSKTFAHGLMDMSLMTSNASQLRAVMSNPGHEFYQLLIWLLIASVILQISSGIILIVSDFFKSQIKEKDRQNQRKRKTLNFLALALMMLITSLNVVITAFNTPSGGIVYQQTATASQQPLFSPSDYRLQSNHTEL